MASCHSERNGVFFEPRHKTLTKQRSVFRNYSRRSFCPAPKIKEATSFEMAFLVSDK